MAFKPDARTLLGLPFSPDWGKHGNGNRDGRSRRQEVYSGGAGQIPKAISVVLTEDEDDKNDERTR